MKYFIKWDAGYGDTVEVLDCDNQKQADEAAEELWQQEVESNASYSAEILTQEHIDEYNLDEELEG